MDERRSYAAQSGGYILNASEAQYFEIEGAFAWDAVEGGWQITMQSPGRVSLYFRAGMRKLDFMMQPEDRLVRTPTDILVIRMQPAESYRRTSSASMYSSSQTRESPLARSNTRQMGSPLAADVESLVQATEAKPNE